jgi:hypothetical protein
MALPCPMGSGADRIGCVWDRVRVGSGACGIGCVWDRVRVMFAGKAEPLPLLYRHYERGHHCVA